MDKLTGLFYTTNPVFYTSGNRFVHRTGNEHVKIIGYQFDAKFKLVFCAKYDSGLDLGFWEILKPLKWTNITNLILYIPVSRYIFFLPETSACDINKAEYVI
jgi:hypothetical protein